jgi:DNA-binding response OmpR family regulator
MSVPHGPDRFDPPRRVLVVDDDVEFRVATASMLRAAGYAVREATGAMHAMRIVLADPLDAVVLDLVLPDAHGIEVARAFRAVATTRDICVVAITAHPGSVEFVDPRSFGAERILIKPVGDAELLAAVEACFAEYSTGEFEIPRGDQPAA